MGFYLHSLIHCVTLMVRINKGKGIQVAVVNSELKEFYNACWFGNGWHFSYEMAAGCFWTAAAKQFIEEG